MISDAVWYVIGGEVTALASVLLALQVILAVINLVVGGAGWESWKVFRRKGVLRGVDRRDYDSLNQILDIDNLS